MLWSFKIQTNKIDKIINKTVDKSYTLDNEILISKILQNFEGDVGRSMHLYF